MENIMKEIEEVYKICGILEQMPKEDFSINTKLCTTLQVPIPKEEVSFTNTLLTEDKQNV